MLSATTATELLSKQESSAAPLGYTLHASTRTFRKGVRRSAHAWSDFLCIPERLALFKQEAMDGKVNLMKDIIDFEKFQSLFDFNERDGSPGHLYYFIQVTVIPELWRHGMKGTARNMIRVDVFTKELDSMIDDDDIA